MITRLLLPPGHAAYLCLLRLIGLEVAEELKMRRLLVERGAALLAQLQTLVGDGQLIAQPRVLLAHPLYLSFLLLPLRLDALHVTAHHRHHLHTFNVGRIITHDGACGQTQADLLF